MPKKIDISPLDKKTKEKIKSLSKRPRQMLNGIPVTIKWTGQTVTIDVDYYNIDLENLPNLTSPQARKIANFIMEKLDS